MLDVQGSDLLTIGLLIVLEGLLSADNALVLAVLVLGLPRDEQRKALRYGIAGAFVFRITATVLAVHMMALAWVKLIGAAYLLWLPYTHFFRSEGAEARRKPRMPTRWLGLSAFWTTVVKVELTDFVFAIDSILVAVAMSNKEWVVITGGVLGIIAMRLVVGRLLAIVQRYPALVDGAFIIVAWVGLKLLIEYLHQIHVIPFELPKWLTFGLIVVIFLVSYWFARRQGPQPVTDPHADETTDLLEDEEREVDLRRNRTDPRTNNP